MEHIEDWLVEVRLEGAAHNQDFHIGEEALDSEDQVDSHCYIDLAEDHTDLAEDHIDLEGGHTGLAAVPIDSGVDHTGPVADHYIDFVAGHTDSAVDRIDSVVGHCIGPVVNHSIEAVGGHIGCSMDRYIELVADTGFVADHTDSVVGIGLVEDHIDYCCKKIGVVVEERCHKESHTAGGVRRWRLVEVAYYCYRRVVHGYCMDQVVEEQYKDCHLVGYLAEVHCIEDYRKADCFAEVFGEILAIPVEACFGLNYCGEYHFEMGRLEETCYVARCQKAESHSGFRLQLK